MLVNRITSVTGKVVLASGVLATALFAMPRPASADTSSTMAIAAAAAVIVGAIAYDNSGRSYYVRDNRRWYVSPDTVNYYRSHRFTQRNNRWNRGGGSQYGRGGRQYGRGGRQYGRGGRQYGRGGRGNPYGSPYGPPRNRIP